MNSKRLVLDALRNNEVQRIPWVPFVGCHAAKLLELSCEDYFKTKEHMVEGVLKANELYNPDGLPALFDLQVEAEAMGCELKYADDNPPCVATHPLESGIDLTAIEVPGENDGRFPVVLDATREIYDKLGKDIAIYGLITGPFTLALHLRGTNIFFDMMMSPDKAHQLFKFCEEVCINTSRMYIEAGVDIIAAVDPMTSQISPKHFEEFVAPYCKNIFEYVRSQGKVASLFVCGDATKNLEQMCKCGPDNLSVDENVDLKTAKGICEEYGVSLGGNIQLTVTMLFGTPLDNVNDAKNCMGIGGGKGFILSPGCDMPFNTPVKNVQAITSTVHGELIDLVQDDSALEGIEVEIPDYPNEDKVIIDAITLDSECCAACQYTVEAIKEAVKGIEDKVQWEEYKVKEPASVVRMLKLGVKNIPTICIDGEIKYVSITPSVEELKEAIKVAYNNKH